MDLHLVIVCGLLACIYGESQKEHSTGKQDIHMGDTVPDPEDPEASMLLQTSLSFSQPVSRPLNDIGVDLVSHRINTSWPVSTPLEDDEAELISKRTNASWPVSEPVKGHGDDLMSRRVNASRMDDAFIYHELTDLVAYESGGKHVEQMLNRVCLADSVMDPVMRVYKPAFVRQTKAGLRGAGSKSLVIAGLARNIASSSTRLFRELRVLGSFFSRYHIILLENDSSDSTREFLKSECKYSDTWCFELKLPQVGKQQKQKNKHRVEHFTLLRQALLTQVRRFTSHAKHVWDFALFFDGDIMAEGNQGFHSTTVASLLGFTVEPKTPFYQKPYDIVCANQLASWPRSGRYRDTFALKFADWNEKTIPKAKYGDARLYMRGNFLRPVKSCFSGLALYSMKAIRESNCDYKFVNEETCEHVTFHKCLAEKGFDKVAIFPPMAVRMMDKGMVKETCFMADPKPDHK